MSVCTVNTAGFLWKNNIENRNFSVLKTGAVKNMNLQKLWKRMFFVTSVIVIACVIASSVITVMTTNTSDVSIDTEEPTQSERVYVLTSYEDRIVAYIKGAERPFIETTTAVSSLPRDEQKKIKAGIEFYSEQELRDALNEYCS